MTKFKRIYIEISNYCNLNCIFCSPKDKNNRILKLEEFKYILDEVSPFTDEVLFHVLGEPLVHPNFKEMSLLVKEKGLKLNITTNGHLIESKYHTLLESYFTTLNISLHSIYHLEQSKKEKYIKVLMDFIHDYKKIYPMTIFHLRLWANSNKIIIKNNEFILNELKKYYDFIPKSRVRLEERVILSYEDEFDWPNLNLEESEGFCLGGKTHVGILANGVVTICCLDALGLTNLGNIFDSHFKEIISSDKYLKTIEEFRKNKCYLELCKHCTYKNKRK